jgi:hypothetical protein
MDAISVIFTVASLASAGNCPAINSVEVVKTVITASGNFLMGQSFSGAIRIK